MGGERHARTQKPTKAAIATLLPLQLCPQVLIEVDFPHHKVTIGGPPPHLFYLQ